MKVFNSVNYYLYVFIIVLKVSVLSVAMELPETPATQNEKLFQKIFKNELHILGRVGAPMELSEFLNIFAEDLEGNLQTRIQPTNVSTLRSNFEEHARLALEPVISKNTELEEFKNKLNAKKLAASKPICTNMTPEEDLWNACQSGDSNKVQLLLKEEVRFDDPQYYPYRLTPLIEASSKGYINIVQLLLDRGAVPGKKGPNGINALMEAVIFGHSNIIELLHKKGTRANDVNICGQTALMLACCNVYPEIVEQLVAAGAVINQADDEGRTPLDYVKVSGASLEDADAIMKFMKSRGAIAKEGMGL